MGGEVIMMIVVVVVVVSKYERLTKRKSVKRNLLPYFEFVKYFRIVFFFSNGEIILIFLVFVKGNVHT